MNPAASANRSSRIWWVMVGMAVFAMGIVIRLVLLQLIEHDQFAKLAEINQYQSVDLQPWRGQIFDHNGVALAVNEVEYQITAAPEMITKADAAVIADKLAPLLNQPRADIQAKLEDKSTKWQQLAPRVSKQVGEAIRDLNFYSIQTNVLQHRVYPQHALAAHVLGFVAGNGQGYYGVEAAFQAELAGEHATGEVSTSPLDVILSPKPRPGADLYLTIDREVQYATEATLAKALSDSGAKSGTIIVMDPRSGALLAMASLPTYDPNVPAASIDDPLRINPAISSQYEPGSVFKVLTMAAALDQGAVTPESTYFDTGALDVGGIVIHNWNGGAWGLQDMTGLLAHSLNVGAATLSTRLGAERFYRGLELFHIGQSLGVDMAGEASGRLKLPGDEDWHEADLATNAYGQGVAVTPLQMIASVAAVANHGKMMKPYVVAATVRDGVREDRQPLPIGQPISPETADKLVAMMTAAVAREVTNAQVPGYTVAGKTGTASIAREGGFYDPQATIASFVGFLPSQDPRVIILIKLDEPTSAEWGSVVAAPVFAELAQKLVVLLEIPPDAVRVNLGQ